MRVWSRLHEAATPGAAVAEPYSTPAGLAAATHAEMAERQGPLFRSVLAYPGFSQAAADVISWELRIARANGARLHTIDYATAPASTEGVGAMLGGERRAAEDRLRELLSAADRLDTAVDAPRLPDVDVHAEEGDPISGLVNTISELQVDLLIVAADDLHRQDEPLIDVLRHGLRRHGLSVLLVHPSEAGRLNRITACVDLSTLAYRVARFALALGREYAAVVRLLHLYHLPWMELEIVAMSEQADVDMTATYERDAIKRMQKWLPETAGDTQSPELVCRQIPNWDYESGIARGTGGENVDLIILPLPRHVLLAARRDATTIGKLASDVKTSLLIVRCQDSS